MAGTQLLGHSFAWLSFVNQKLTPLFILLSMFLKSRYVFGFLLPYIMTCSSSWANLGCGELVSSNTSIEYTQSLRKLVLQNPELFLDKKIDGKENNIGFPFRIRNLKTLPEYLLSAVQDIHTLSNSDRARSQVFGSAKRQTELMTELLKSPLQLRSKSNPVDGFFVEVGVDIFTLEGGEHRYIYWTSNASNHVILPYEFRADLIEELESTGQKVLALESFHSHPLTLFPSMEDKIYFTQELALIRIRYPHLKFDDWKMSTTMDSESTIHEVQLSDWFK